MLNYKYRSCGNLNPSFLMISISHLPLSIMSIHSSFVPKPPRITIHSHSTKNQPVNTSHHMHLRAHNPFYIYMSIRYTIVSEKYIIKRQALIQILQNTSKFALASGLSNQASDRCPAKIIVQQHKSRSTLTTSPLAQKLLW